LEAGALSEEKFAEWSKDYVLLCHVTTQVAGEKHANLLQEKGGQGFPYVAFMDAEGAVAGKHQGARTVDGFDETARKAKRFVELKTRAAGGDKAAAIDLFLAEAETGSIPPPDVRKRAAELTDLTPEQKKSLDALLAGLDALEILLTVKPDKQSRIDAGKKYLDMKMAGRIPSGDVAFNFWSLILDYCESTKDVATYEEGVRFLRAKLPDHARAKKFLADKEKILEQLKSGSK
jgi:hypothetical protein